VSRMEVVVAESGQGVGVKDIVADAACSSMLAASPLAAQSTVAGCMTHVSWRTLVEAWTTAYSECVQRTQLAPYLWLAMDFSSCPVAVLYTRMN
jgi:hypothetical protein